MADFALITCARKQEKEKGNESTGRGLVQKLLFLIKRLWHAVTGKDDETSRRIVELHEGVRLHIVILPYGESELKDDAGKRINKARGVIKRYSASHGIDRMIFPTRIEYLFEDCRVSCPGRGSRFLYRALMINILEEIYVRRGVRLNELDIALAGSGDINGMMDAVRKLSPLVKYLTVVSDDSEAIKEETDRLCEDTGMPIMVTSDFRRGMKEADCIINLGGLKEIAINSCTRKGALILNYGELNMGKILSENVLINGIKVGLPSCHMEATGLGINGVYDELELAEMILAAKLGRSSTSEPDNSDDGFLRAAADEFRKDGYRIAGFMGRRAILKSADMESHIRKLRLEA